jgi:hypothetical protein
MEVTRGHRTPPPPPTQSAVQPPVPNTAKNNTTAQSVSEIMKAPASGGHPAGCPCGLHTGKKAVSFETQTKADPHLRLEKFDQAKVVLEKTLETPKVSTPATTPPSFGVKTKPQEWHTAKTATVTVQMHQESAPSIKERPSQNFVPATTVTPHLGPKAAALSIKLSISISNPVTQSHSYTAPALLKQMATISLPPQAAAPVKNTISPVTFQKPDSSSENMANPAVQNKVVVAAPMSKTPVQSLNQNAPVILKTTTAGLPQELQPVQFLKQTLVLIEKEFALNPQINTGSKNSQAPAERIAFNSQPIINFNLLSQALRSKENTPQNIAQLLFNMMGHPMPTTEIDDLEGVFAQWRELQKKIRQKKEAEDSEKHKKRQPHIMKKKKDSN